MPKRCTHDVDDDDHRPPVKKIALDLRDQILVDNKKKRWRVGESIGVGAFGEIFTASDKTERKVKATDKYVVKIERHTNGPLFVEINCYLRIAKPDLIDEWKKVRNLKELGIPPYTASGSHWLGDMKCRFLILPRYTTDLQRILTKQHKLHLKPVITVSLQLLDVLQYIHSQHFVHGDIKASNILLNLTKPVRKCRSAKTSSDRMYLLDYGLASKYKLSNGEHKSADMRRANAGTITFCSLDAHAGALSRRSDLESLGYNIVYWLTGHLPWIKNGDDPDVVRRKKRQCMSHLEPFLNLCFGSAPKFLIEYFQYLTKLNYTSEPDYDYCRGVLTDALFEYGLKPNGKFDLDMSEPWQRKKDKNVRDRNVEPVIRTPLRSNLPSKKVLRKKNKKDKAMNWSKILMDPEEILKQAKTKERKLTESSNDGSHSLLNLDIRKLNPTEAMLEVYYNYLERVKSGDGYSPKYRIDNNNGNLEGYTPAMMQVHNKMMENREIERATKTATKKKPTSKPDSEQRTGVRTRNQSRQIKTILDDAIIKPKRRKRTARK